MDIFLCTFVLQCSKTILGCCPKKMGFLPLPPPPPRKVFRSSSPLGVMFLSLDLICLYIVMNACGSTIMLVIF